MITINDKEYDEESLTDEQKHLVRQTVYCRQQAELLLSQAQVHQIAEKQYTDALVASVEGESVAEVEE